MSKFSVALKALRLKSEYTQKQIADLVGVSESAIGMYERGMREPNFETLEVIADIFNVQMSDLIDSTPETTKTAQGEMTLNGFDHALLDLTKEYTQEQKAQFLENAKIFDNSLKWKEQQGGE